MKKALHGMTRKNFLSNSFTAATAFTLLPAHILAGGGRVSLQDKLNRRGEGEDERQTGEWSWLFNGKNLEGWENVNGASSTWTVQDNKLICSGEPHGFLRTLGVYENYILELEWRLMEEGGNSGIFLHADSLPELGAPSPSAIEAQIYDGDHGSIFGIRGTRLTPVTNPGGGHAGSAGPTEKRINSPGEWNHYSITCQNGKVSLAVNGKTVTKARNCSQVKGHIGLQSETGKVQFRSIRIKPLPSSFPPAEKVADVKKGFISLFDGATLQGWEHSENVEGHWIADNGVIRYDGEGPRGENLWTREEFEDYILIADWRFTAEPERRIMSSFQADGLFRRDVEGNVLKEEVLFAGDSGIYPRGESKSQVNMWCKSPGSGDINGYHKDASFPEKIRRAAMPTKKADNPLGEWNRFVITMTGERVSVVLNEEKVINQAWLPGIPDKGNIALQNHGDPVEFRNMFLKKLSYKGE